VYKYTFPDPDGKFGPSKARGVALAALGRLQAR
jgi:hypothetical protein